MNQSTTFGLGFDQLASVFLLGVQEPSAAGPGSDPATVLQLSMTDAIAEGWLPEGLEQGTSQTVSQAQFLAEGKTELVLLKAVKSHAKQLIRDIQCQQSKACATILYYTVIAKALVCFDTPITQLSRTELTQAFGTFLKRADLPKEIRSLFTQAQQQCTHPSGAQ